MVHDTAVAVSAPGKVLLAGGYLVLDRDYTGLVFGLDARIHVTIQPIETSSGVTLNEIVVQSPQFADAVWEYGYRLTEQHGGIQVVQLRPCSYSNAELNLNRNAFIETALGYALSYIASASSPQISPASITILADNDYYSTPHALSNGTSSASRFHNFGVPISKAHKTGLGSSAALVTAFTAALLTYYLPSSTFDLESEDGKRRLHNLAQAAHCAAQGKVGSGFDVASAVYGSCLYRRFSPCLLSSHVEPGQPHFGTQLREIVNEVGTVGAWDHSILKNEVKVPRGLRLVMCDVSCGSQTPGMVKKVLAWRKERADEAAELWSRLDTANRTLAEELRLAAEAAQTQADEPYATIRASFQTIRTLIRQMSAKSGVPIEPPEQTALLDACERIPGVLGGVVPGAGGYDAVSLLIVDDQVTVDQLEELFASWKFGTGTDGDVGGGRVSMLGVREEMQGIKNERPRDYEKWLS
ncbi:hypothetical protein BAUCODRAFT_134639 [Baudoinia panamericana UAMH 10762]|uniref:Phosphomevalonate kinase n=1 Tax=Baudoinia panamericana (strain UAMH 10762) TaxID=717646 RepID=M2MZX3_BAUPA|nr:uncharacterized protein BAUCODRAFT_134639 [Baudoinia panamericana UAMH 10762]EMC91875.1 hypothetical protein BAUCODRAFT_134639 [Baudoinia panamericana UAMH 10762]